MRLIIQVAVVCAVAGAILDRSPAHAQDQPCGGSYGMEYSSGSGTGCPGTTQTRQATYSLSGNTQCEMSGLNASYSLPSGQTIFLTQTGTCAPGSPAQCDFTEDVDSTSVGDGTLYSRSWNNGVYVSGCILQPAYSDRFVSQIAACVSTFCCALGADGCGARNGVWDSDNCSCRFTPLLVVLNGRWQSALGAAEGGPGFLMMPLGTASRVAWPHRGQRQVGWLVRDRNGNGEIDDGAELYGSATIQLADAGEMRHGFKALSLEDTNGDGFITEADANYAYIQVWFDSNHDGQSQTSELVPLTDLGVTRLGLRYRQLNRTDANGNKFVFESKGVQQRDETVRFIDIYDVMPRTAALTTSAAGGPPF